MNALSVKKKIKKKFGSMSNFARLAGYNRYDLQVRFASPAKHRKFIAQIDREASSLKAEKKDGAILPVKLELLKTALMSSGGVVAFCRDNSQFSDRTVFQILQGRRKRMSPVVEQLFKHFNL